MENEKKISEEAIDDKELEAVAGGVQLLEFGMVGSTSDLGINRVKVIDGSKCPTCGSTIGVLAYGADGDLCVKCEKCGVTILDKFRSDAIAFGLI